MAAGTETKAEAGTETKAQAFREAADMSHRVIVNVDAEVDLEDFDTKDLVAELRRRGNGQAAEDLEAAVTLLRESLAELRQAIAERRTDDAVALIDRIFTPKYHDVFACRDKYKRLMEART